MKYFDVHAHVFPHAIAAKAVTALENYYGYRWHGTAEIDDLVSSLRDAGVGRCVIFSSATKPEQVRNVNDFIAGASAQYPELFVGFGTMHPDYPDIPGETERIRQLGLKGIKFHPDFQKFHIDDPKALKMYECAGSDLVMLFHVGDAHVDYSAPERLARVLELFPEAKIIAAHMGGYSCWGQGEKFLVGKNVYLDISSTVSTGKISYAEIDRLIKLHGVDKILFASDYPAVRHDRAIFDFFQLDLTSEEREKVSHLNAEKLLGAAIRD